MKILIIDDEKTIRKALGFALRKKGYQILEKETALESMRVIQSHSFDLIIIDNQMPFMDGETFIERTREAGIETPVIMLTSETTLFGSKHEKNDRNLYAVSKDLDLSEIIHIIENKLDQIEQGEPN